MKREILFRGKTLDTNHWVYGFYVHDPEDGHLIVNFKSTVFEPETNASDIEMVRNQVFEETVCQLVFIKEQTKFFEGDIVMYDLESGLGEPKRIDNKAVLGFGYTGWQTNFRLLGNKFDNPELIKNYRNEF